MAENVLQSFLVTLGFKTDEASLRRFHEGLTRTSTAVKDFALGIGALAVTVEESIRRVAKSFADLHYLSEEVGVSVGNLQSVEFAFKQIGLSGGEALSMFKRFDSGLRDAPGLKYLVERYVPGFASGMKSSKDAIFALAEQYQNTIKTFGERSVQEAQLRTAIQAMGLDPDTILRSAKELKAYDEAMKFHQGLLEKFGIKADESGDSAVSILRSWNKLWDILSVAFQKLIVQFFPDIDKGLDDLATWFEKDGIPLITEWVGWIKRTYDEWKKWLDNGGWTKIKGYLTEIGDIAKDVALIFAVGWAVNMVAAIVSVGTALATFAASPAFLAVAALAASAVALKTLVDQGTGKPNSWTDPKSPLRFADPSMPFATGAEDEESKKTDEALRKWIEGQKQTPWVKIESTPTDPILVKFSSDAFEGMKDLFHEMYGGTPAGGGAGGGGGGGGGAGAGGPSGRAGDIQGGGQVPKGVGFNIAMLKQLALDVGFKGHDADVMAATWMHESSGNPYAVGDSGHSFGLAQIYDRAHADARKAYGDPLFAARKSYELYQARQRRGQTGFEDWSSWLHGHYRTYLTAAERATPQNYPTREQLEAQRNATPTSTPATAVPPSASSSPEHHALIRGYLVPPGTQFSQTGPNAGKPFSAGLATMSAAEKANEAASMAWIKANMKPGGGGWGSQAPTTTVHNTTHIHVTGGHDPQSTAHHVSRALREHRNRRTAIA